MAEYWMTMTERVGVPLTILFFFGMAVWISLRWLAKKIFEPIAKSHVDLVNTVKESSDINSKTLVKVSDILALKIDILDKLDDTNNKVYELAVLNKDRIDKLTNAVSLIHTKVQAVKSIAVTAVEEAKVVAATAVEEAKVIAATAVEEAKAVAISESKKV